MLSMVPTPRDLAVLAPPYARIRYTELCGSNTPPAPAPPAAPPRSRPRHPRHVNCIRGRLIRSGPRARLLLRSHLTRTSRPAARLADARVGLACPRRAVARGHRHRRAVRSAAPRPRRRLGQFQGLNDQ